MSNTIDCGPPDRHGMVTITPEIAAKLAERFVEIAQSKLPGLRVAAGDKLNLTHEIKVFWINGQIACEFEEVEPDAVVGSHS